MPAEKDLEAGGFGHEEGPGTMNSSLAGPTFNVGSDGEPSGNPRVGMSSGAGEGDAVDIGLHADYLTVPQVPRRVIMTTLRQRYGLSTSPRLPNLTKLLLKAGLRIWTGFSYLCAIIS